MEYGAQKAPAVDSSAAVSSRAPQLTVTAPMDHFHWNNEAQKVSALDCITLSGPPYSELELPLPKGGGTHAVTSHAPIRGGSLGVSQCDTTNLQNAEVSDFVSNLHMIILLPPDSDQLRKAVNEVVKYASNDRFGANLELTKLGALLEALLREGADQERQEHVRPFFEKALDMNMVSRVGSRIDSVNETNDTIMHLVTEVASRNKGFVTPSMTNRLSKFLRKQQWGLFAEHAPQAPQRFPSGVPCWEATAGSGEATQQNFDNGLQAQSSGPGRLVIHPDRVANLAREISASKVSANLDGRGLATHSIMGHSNDTVRRTSHDAILSEPAQAAIKTPIVDLLWGMGDISRSNYLRVAPKIVQNIRDRAHRPQDFITECRNHRGAVRSMALSSSTVGGNMHARLQGICGQVLPSIGCSKSSRDVKVRVEECLTDFVTQNCKYFPELLGKVFEQTHRRINGTHDGKISNDS